MIPGIIPGIIPDYPPVIQHLLYHHHYTQTLSDVLHAIHMVPSIINSYTI